MQLDSLLSRLVVRSSVFSMYWHNEKCGLSEIDFYTNAAVAILVRILHFAILFKCMSMTLE